MRRWISQRSDERGSLPLAMLLTIVGLSLSGMLAANLTAQLTANRTTIQRSDALDAAQTGIEIALGRIRTARNADGTGDYAKLPCGPFEADITPATRQHYRVVVSYLLSKPPAGPLTTAALPCPAGGLYTGTDKPIYVFLSSAGQAKPGLPSRTVTATYTLRTKSRENVAGGLIPVYDTTPVMCLSAPSTTPVTGAALTVQACDGANGAQRFAYDSNLNLVLVSTRANGSTGMCLDAVAHNDPVVFRPCATPTTFRQQWSLNDRGSFEGTTDGSNLNNTCFHLSSTPAPGVAVVLHSTAQDPGGTTQQDSACRFDYSNMRTFTPDAETGTGGAGRPLASSTSTTLSTQLVNFDQFGRCLDVTAENVDESFLVIWPCKQSPSGVVLWNQTWAMPAVTSPNTNATGQIRTTEPTKGAHCLVSPGNTAGYVRVQPCASATAAATQWTRRTGTGIFANAYRIESTFGAPAGVTYCLQPTDPKATGPDLWQQGASKSVVRVCDASALQKWNASPTILTSALQDISEN